jgi:hypothetical protein
MRSLSRISLLALLMAVILFCAFGFAASFEPPGSWGAAYIHALGASAGALPMTGLWLAPRGKLQN